MHGDAGHLAGRVEARQRRPLRIDHDARIKVGWDAAHGVVRRWLDRHRLGDRLDAQVVAREVGDVRQFFVDDLGPQVPHIQVDIVFAVDAVPVMYLLEDDSARRYRAVPGPSSVGI